jgi:proline iminopeptidase
MATQGYTHDPPFDKGYLPVGPVHKLHYEQYGNPNGKPGTPTSSLKKR